MVLLTLLVADYANVTREGKPNVMGIFRSINASDFPARHPSMHLVVSLAASPAEYGTTRDLWVKLITEDGKNSIVDWHSPIAIPHGAGGRRVEVNRILRLDGVVFPEPGDYQFSVLVDNDEKGTLPLHVSKLINDSPSGNA